MHATGLSVAMGKSSMAKLGNHREVQSERSIWEILGKGGVHRYLMNYQGHDLAIEDVVVAIFNNG